MNDKMKKMFDESQPKIYLMEFVEPSNRADNPTEYNELGKYLDYLNQELLPNDISDVFGIKYDWMVSKGLTSSKTEFAESEFVRLKSCRAGLFIPYLKYLQSVADERIDFRALIIALNFKGGVLTGTYANQAEILRRDFGVTKTQSTLERVLSNLAPNKDFLEYQIKDNTAIHSDKERYARIKQIYDSGGIDQYINDLSGN